MVAAASDGLSPTRQSRRLRWWERRWVCTGRVGWSLGGHCRSRACVRAGQRSFIAIVVIIRGRGGGGRKEASWRLATLKDISEAKHEKRSEAVSRRAVGLQSDWRRESRVGGLRWQVAEA